MLETTGERRKNSQAAYSNEFLHLDSPILVEKQKL